MTRDGKNGGKSPPPEDTEGNEATATSERLLESLRHEIAKSETAEYEPTRDELRVAEPDARYWQARVNERRRENLANADAVGMSRETPSLVDRSREWLLARLAELRELASTLPGGVQLAHRNLDARDLDDVPTEEIRSQVADLELAITAELSSTSSR